MATPLVTGSDWLATHPPDAGRLTATLAGVARRVVDGEDFSHAVREFLDEFALRGDNASRAQAIAERPRATGDPRHDAYLGALAEHLASWGQRRDVRGRRRGDRPCLALKVLAHRVGEDEGDVRLLAGHLGLKTAEQVLAVAEQAYGDRLDPAARFFVEEVFGAEADDRG